MTKHQVKKIYGFDEYGQFSSVKSVQSADTNLFTYSYLPGSHLISVISTPDFSARKTYEPSRDLITTVSNTFGTATISTFVYENDAFGRRTARVDTTPTLTVNNAFGYNLKSEVTSATMANGDSKYNYDPIGNRVFASLNALTNTYSANALNQYTKINPLNPVNPVEEIKPSYDLDGNMITNGVWSYSWDAENRLTAVYSNDTLLVSNVYDHQSRRIAKIVSRRGAEAQRREFIYDDWNLIQELITDNGLLTTNSFTWGLDLSGSLQGAGGVGGLLAVHRDSSSYFPCFDANGNVTEYVDASGTIRAHYAFDAFGNTISQSGDLADAFSYRFSTKYLDGETGLYYYGYRYYAPELGRWVNRDPIGEEGGKNVHGFLNNNTILFVDALGFKAQPPVVPPVQFPGSCCSVDDIKNEIVTKSKAALKEMMDKPLIVEYIKKNKKTGLERKIEVKWFREYAGYICCNKQTKKVTSTGPYPGTWKNMDANEEFTEKPWEVTSKATTANITDDEKTKCPKGTDAVAFYHTHPDSPEFSKIPGDLGFAIDNNIVITLLAPGMDKILVGMVGIGTGEIPLPPEKR
jgi:RHS repeat-associated protein